MQSARLGLMDTGTITELDSTIDCLKKEYQRLKDLSPGFSLRKFALRLGISSGRLCEYLSGKRRITPEIAQKMIERLDYTPEEKANFCHMARVEREKKLLNRSKRRKQVFKTVLPAGEHNFETQLYSHFVPELCASIRVHAEEKAKIECVVYLKYDE